MAIVIAMEIIMAAVLAPMIATAAQVHPTLPQDRPQDTSPGRLRGRAGKRLPFVAILTQIIIASARVAQLHLKAPVIRILQEASLCSKLGPPARVISSAVCRVELTPAVDHGEVLVQIF